MADTQEPHNRAQRTKITLADIGVPSAVKAMTPEQLAKSGGKLVLGRLIGIAGKFVVRKSPKDQTEFEGLGGSFRVIPADPAAEELESGVMFIPDAYHNMIAGQLRKAQENDAGATVSFSFQVSAIPAKNPAGYSWEFLPLLKPAGTNALDDLWTETVKLAPPKGAARIEQRK